MTDYFVDPVAEQRVLGSVIASGGGVLRDLALTAEDFAGGAHAELWKAIHAYLETGKPLTPELLVSYVREHGRAAQLAPVIVECMSGVGVPSEATWHAVGLRTLTARRRLAQAQTAVGQVAAGMPDATPEELFEAARGQLDRFTDRSVTTGGAQSFADAYLEALETWAKPDTNVLPTRWTALDEKLTGGLRPGHLCIVGARPAIGKSLMATELARQVSSRGGVVLLHSLEMTTLEVVNRIAAAVTKVPLEALTSGRTTESEMDTLGAGFDKVHTWPLTIDDRSGMTVAGIRAKARDIVHETGRLDLVVVDYLQLVRPADPKAPREQQVGSISRGLKLLAKDLGVPVVALAQVNRASEAESNRRPQMHNLRESGSIEADADEILLLHRNPPGTPEEDDDLYGKIEVNVVKNRHGATGVVELAWLPAGGTIGNLAY